MLCEDAVHPSRRAILGAAGALFAWSFAPRYAFAAGGRDPRLVVVVLRGALDGLAAVPPVGDPGYVPLRPGLALPASGDGAALPLDGFFGLHPAMPNLARLYRRSRRPSSTPPPPAIASARISTARTCWRAASRAPASPSPAGSTVPSRCCPPASGSAQGRPRYRRHRPAGGARPGPVLGWAPQGLQQADDDVARRVLQLYDEREPRLAAALRQGLDTSRMASASGLGALRPRSSPADPEGMALIATGAAKLMAAADGPRVAALALEGWDTHVNAGGATGQLATRLGGLDRVFAIFEEELKAVWRETVVVVMTEFGRTARVNGTTGTDHGTATVAFLAGGAVKGGRVVADWPGLAPNKLFEGRDLAATTDLRAVLKGVLVEHLGMDAKPLAETIFPGTLALPPMRGLIG